MLILRDRLKNSPHGAPTDMATLLANQAAAGKSPPADATTPTAPPGPSPTPRTPDQQEEAYRRVIQRQTEELKKRVVDKDAIMDEWTVKTWLQL